MTVLSYSHGHLRSVMDLSPNWPQCLSVVAAKFFDSLHHGFF